MDSAPSANDLTAASVPRRLLARNTLFLVLAKVVSTPISIFNNAIMARFLGAEEFGYFYVAQAYAAFVGLVISWGQVNTLPAATARDRRDAPDLLGSGLALRMVLAIVVSVAIAVGFFLVRPQGQFRLILLLVFVQTVFACFGATYQDVLRGFERTDVDALLSVLGPLFGTAVGIVILLLGGRVPALVVAGTVISSLLFLYVRRELAAAGVARPEWSRRTVRVLTHEGLPFLFFGFALALQPAIDAAFLSRLAPAEVVGWHAVATKIVGVLVFPAGALMASLYPVLCRLHATDPRTYARSTADSLRVSILIVIPLAAGCALFPDLAVRAFSRRTYGPAQDNLRILSLFVFALYFTMPLGSALLAAGRQRAWAIVQSLCVVSSLVLDPLLIPLFQRRAHNGGLGICVSVTLSEFIMVIGALVLLPPGVLNRATGKSLLLGLLGGAAMAAVAYGLTSVTSFVTAPLSLAVYAACLLATGAIRKDEVLGAKRIIFRRVGG